MWGRMEKPLWLRLDPTDLPLQALGRPIQPTLLTTVLRFRLRYSPLTAKIKNAVCFPFLSGPGRISLEFLSRKSTKESLRAL
jgi:hypothetical protein